MIAGQPLPGHAAHGTLRAWYSHPVVGVVLLLEQGPGIARPTAGAPNTAPDGLTLANGTVLCRVQDSSNAPVDHCRRSEAGPWDYSCAWDGIERWADGPSAFGWRLVSSSLSPEKLLSLAEGIVRYHQPLTGSDPEVRYYLVRTQGEADLVQATLDLEGESRRHITVVAVVGSPEQEAVAYDVIQHADGVRATLGLLGVTVTDLREPKP